MDDAWLGLGVAGLVVLVLLAAVLHDLFGRRRPARAGDVDDAAVRRARQHDARHLQPGQSVGSTAPPF